jgi:uncharacterized OB-fold protein
MTTEPILIFRRYLQALRKETDMGDGDKCPNCGAEKVEGRLNCEKCGAAYPDMEERDLERDPNDQGE